MLTIFIAWYITITITSHQSTSNTTFFQDLDMRSLINDMLLQMIISLSDKVESKLILNLFFVCFKMEEEMISSYLCLVIGDVPHGVTSKFVS